VLSPPQPVGEAFLMDYMAFHSLRRSGEEWTWKFDPEVFRQNSADQGWHEIGKRVVGVPGRKAIVYGAESLLFTPDSADYVKELGGTDIPIIAIPAARHHLMLDQPLAFVTALRAILAMWQTTDDN
jgi:pimeloyl-ACP methyl ester carboxylesterase